jgi:hypothetical protein
MSKRLLAALAVLVLTGVVAVTAVAGAAPSTRLHATLSGKNELGKGAANGRGTFTASFRGGKLCYTLKFSGIRQPLAAHIHKGTARQNGTILVDLLPRFRNGRSSRCVPVKSSVARAIRRNPSGYYVNVHTKKLPAGAIRGQLSGR